MLAQKPERLKMKKGYIPMCQTQSSGLRRGEQVRVASIFAMINLLVSCGGPSGPANTSASRSGGCRYGSPAARATEVTFSELAKNGQAYHGRRIRIHGLLKLDFENAAVYDIQGPCNQFRGTAGAESVWLKTLPPVPLREQCGNRQAFVEGIYDADERGTWDTTGGLSDINLVQSTGPTCNSPTRLLGRAGY